MMAENTGLTEADLAQFQQQGYCIKPGVFTEPDLQPMRDAITAEISDEAQKLKAGGELSDTFADDPFATRLSHLLRAYGRSADSILRRFTHSFYHGPEILNLQRHPSLTSCVTDIVGPDVIGSSVYRIRPKVPYQKSIVSWHQDSAYLLPHCDDLMIVTCWIPLVDVTKHNGCLYVIPGVHNNGIYTHYERPDGGYLIMTDDELPGTEPVACEMTAGSVLFFTNRTPHASFYNKSDGSRWSVDVRYQSSDVPNNVGEGPEDVTADRDPSTMACYPPEADFVILDSANRENEITSYEDLARIRRRFMKNRPKFDPRYSSINGRGWTTCAAGVENVPPNDVRS